MADPQSSAALSAHPKLPEGAPRAGVVHVRHRHTDRSSATTSPSIRASPQPRSGSASTSSRSLTGPPSRSSHSPCASARVRRRSAERSMSWRPPATWSAAAFRSVAAASRRERSSSTSRAAYESHRDAALLPRTPFASGQSVALCLCLCPCPCPCSRSRNGRCRPCHPHRRRLNREAPPPTSSPGYAWPTPDSFCPLVTYIASPRQWRPGWPAPLPPTRSPVPSPRTCRRISCRFGARHASLSTASRPFSRPHCHPNRRPLPPRLSHPSVPATAANGRSGPTGPMTCAWTVGRRIQRRPSHARR